MIIIIDRWRKKLSRLMAVIALILAFVLAIPVLSGLWCDKVPALSRWFQDEHPTGNPMRVQNETGSRFDRAVGQFVIKLQDFYYDERE